MIKKLVLIASTRSIYGKIADSELWNLELQKILKSG